MACLLVVDDDECNLEIIAEFLRDQSHELVFAHDGLEAWRLLEAEPTRFDAIILDRVMPRMDGMEVLRRIRGDPAFTAVPVIIQTASGAPEEMAEGLAAGAWSYLAKPYNALALGSVVRGALLDRANRLDLERLSAELHGLLMLIQTASFRFRTPQEARLLAAVFAQVCANGEIVALGLAELLLNAVEHGNLGVGYQEKSRLLETGTWQDEIDRRLATTPGSERWAELTFTREPDALCFMIHDQGEGFEWARYLDLDPARAFDSHGRGIALARQLAFSSLDYLERGNRVRARVQLDN